MLAVRDGGCSSAGGCLSSSTGGCECERQAGPTRLRCRSAAVRKLRLLASLADIEQAAVVERTEEDSRGRACAAPMQAVSCERCSSHSSEL